MLLAVSSSPRGQHQLRRALFGIGIGIIIAHCNIISTPKSSTGRKVILMGVIAAAVIMKNAWRVDKLALLRFLVKHHHHHHHHHPIPITTTTTPFQQ